MDSNLTADSELLSTVHDRRRRAERQVEKITLQEARRYGMAEKQSNGRIKYVYAGHVFIYDAKANKAITSWKIDPDRKPGGYNNGKLAPNGGKKKKKKKSMSGTQFFKPLLIHQSNDHDKLEVVSAHDTIALQVRMSKEKWTSHTVLVVDMSGSMRDDDISGARCRADGVWTTLARDFVKGQLESKTCSVYDLVSVVVMRKTAKVAVECEPLTFVLYNKLVSFREWDNLKPSGHGFYKPALERAEELLTMNSSGSCALTLMFFSDGKPSDFYQDNQGEFDWKQYNAINDELVALTGSIASRFGRRLNMDFVGMAGEEENFNTLERMALEAQMFGAQATFNRPDLNTSSLSRIVSSSLASSLSSKTEWTSLKTGTSRSVRTDVERERLNAPDDRKVNNNWRVFSASNEKSYVGNVWAWNAQTNDFAKIIDPRCHLCYKTVAELDYTLLRGVGDIICPGCRSCYFCARCRKTGGLAAHARSKDCQDFLALRRTGFLVGKSICPLTFSVAWKKKAFGEGAERLAFKFRFVNDKNKFIGPVMVAKESRFTEDLNDAKSATNYLRSHRHSYHKSFMRTQATAARFAKRFNGSLREFHQTRNISFPTIQFVDPLIFELEDAETARTYNILVEPLIEGKYKKFSDNFGALAPEVKREFSVENEGVNLKDAAVLLGRETEKNETVPIGHTANLDIIAEGSEDEEESDDDHFDSDDDTTTSSEVLAIDVSTARDTDYLAAFSHFTYVFSGGNLMVVDLQGALQKKGDANTFMLTDPAIHHRRGRNEKTRQYGRTDLGRKGMRAFFESHKCNDICRLFQFREKTEKSQLDQLYRVKDGR